MERIILREKTKYSYKGYFSILSNHYNAYHSLNVYERMINKPQFNELMSTMKSNTFYDIKTIGDSLITNKSNYEQFIFQHKNR